jgi:hypothetical protein
MHGSGKSFDARLSLSIVMPALVAGIHVFLISYSKQGVDGRDISAFTRVFDALCPAMTADRQVGRQRE